MVVPFLSMPYISPLVKRAPFHTRSASHSMENMFGLYFKQLIQLKTSSAHRALRSQWPLQPSSIRGLCGKRQVLAFRDKPPLGLVFFHWVAYTLQVRILESSCFVSFVRLLSCRYHPGQLGATFPL